MSDGEKHAIEPLVEPLTRREREILGRLNQGYSAPEIAEQLTLAVSTIKSHIQQVYGKLGVNSKRQALTRAQELGLLDHALPAAPPKPSPVPKHNLPLQVTRFFGRENEIAQLKERLTEYRLVTLTGSGGVGKTRLSLRTTEDVLGLFPDGVWLVELAPLSDPALMPQQVAVTLKLRDIPSQSILETLTAFLRDRQLLLVLDNCEHLLNACAQFANAVLRACPDVKLLATSREALGIDGESIFLVPSLPFADPGDLPPLEKLSEYTALSLFVDRARAVLPSYALTPQNAPYLARICQRLAGIPLAIEMAAARVPLLNAEMLAARLDDVFRLLTGGSRTALPRQQTLRATMDWSYRLLVEEERLLLQRLSVFAGGCTLEAAETVCADPAREEGLDASAVLDALASLVTKSIVIAERQPGKERRYRLLEVVRQYAREKLEAAGESQHLHTRHQSYFLTRSETTSSKILTSEGLNLGNRLLAEQENLRLALEWSLSEHSDPSNVEAGPRLITSLMGPSGLIGSREALDWCNRAIVWCQSHAGISDLVYAHLVADRARALARFDLPSGVAGLKEAVEFSRRLGPEGKKVLMRNLSDLGRCLASLNEIEQAWAAYAEAEAILHELGPGRFSPGEYLTHRGYVALEKAGMANKQGRYADAKMYADESIRLHEENGQPWRACGGHVETGQACLELGEYDQAYSHFLTALNLDPVRDIAGRAYTKRCLGLVALRLGNLDKAQEYCQASVREADRAGDINCTAIGVELAAMIAAKHSQPMRAATLSGASQALYASSGRKPWEDSSLDSLLPGWRDRPDYAVLSQAFEAGQAMSVDEAVMYALDDTTP